MRGGRGAVSAPRVGRLGSPGRFAKVDWSWFVSYVVDNDETWSRVKSGEFTGFSVEGVFDFNTEIPVGYVEQDFSADDILLAKIYDIVNQWDGQ